jgi:hypothetical protein
MGTTSGISNHATGTFTGAGAAVEADIGFTPRIVRVHNITDRISDEKFEGMTDAQTLRTVAAGTRTLETGSQIVIADPAADGFRGFTVAATAAIAAKVIVWEAIG